MEVQEVSDLTKLVRAIVSDPHSVQQLRAAIVAPAELALIPMGEVSRISGLSKSEVWRRVQSRTFPAPVKLGEGEKGAAHNRCTRWSQAEVEAWVRDRLASREKRRAA